MYIVAGSRESRKRDTSNVAGCLRVNTPPLIGTRLSEICVRKLGLPHAPTLVGYRPINDKVFCCGPIELKGCQWTSQTIYNTGCVALLQALIPPKWN